MNYYVNPKQVSPIYREGSHSFELLKEENGCVAGCCTGITVFTTAEYPAVGVHEDQEGFIVIEGTGWAKVGDEEFRIEPEMSFLAPAGIRHCIKKDADSVSVKVFWFHAAI
jgi:mannose-6-phosphate isomerase-like protein (cupin superfamily)